MSPTYEFKCAACSTEHIDRIYTAFTSIEDRDKEHKCPVCGESLKRVKAYALPFTVN